MRWGRWAVVLLVAASVGCASTGVVEFPDGAGGVVAPADADVVGPIRLVGRELVDATGRVVIIHGTNSVQKSEPYLSALEDGWLGPADLERFRVDGFNGVRLGVWAAALMPEPGVIDTDYLDRVAEVVDVLEAHHLWVLLDFHQDVFWGMPDWATTPAAAALSSRPPAELAGIGWAAAYGAPRSLRQWEDWWDDVPTTDGRGVREAFGDGVAAVADRFADEPTVIGIDLLNEPFAGDEFLSCVLASCAARYAQVTQAFTELTARARAVAPDLPVWWEPFVIGAPFPGVAAPPANVGYTFHAYCLGTDGGEPTAPDPVAVAFCNEVFTGIFNQAGNVGASWNVPTLLGEFGASVEPAQRDHLDASGGPAPHVVDALALAAAVAGGGADPTRPHLRAGHRRAPDPSELRPGDRFVRAPVRPRPRRHGTDVHRGPRRAVSRRLHGLGDRGARSRRVPTRGD